MKLKPSSRSFANEAGSAIVIILVCVGLFGALSFAVAQMLREGNPQAISEEKSRLYAQEVMTYANGIRDAVRDLRISNGCADTAISFEAGNLANYNHTPAAQDACKVFNPAGGGLAYAPPVKDWLELNQSAENLYGKIYVTGKVCIPGIGEGATNGCASDDEDNEELILYIPYIRREVCMQINRITAGSGDDAPPPIESGNGWLSGVNTNFKGAYEDGESLDQDNKNAGCFEGSAVPAADSYSFFMVLIPR